MGGPLEAGDANRLIRLREAKEQAAEEKRRQERIKQGPEEEHSPTPAPRLNRSIFDPSADLLF
jgi:hypothetical protein